MKAPTISFRTSKSPFSITTELTSSIISSAAMFSSRIFNLKTVVYSVCWDHDSFKCPGSTIDIDPSRCSKTFLTVTTDSTFPTNFSLGSSKNVEELTTGEPCCCCLDQNLGKLTSLKVLLLLFYRVHCSNSIFPTTRGFIPLELLTKNLLLVMNCPVEES